jgi:hypothetical protein
MVQIGEENNTIIVLPVPIEILSVFGKQKKD